MSNQAHHQQIPKVYDPHQVEAKRYQWWMERGYFEGTIEDDGRPRYAITIPPPNITGSLHLGHALNHAVQDLLVRYKRMRGFNTICIPGTDHAGIATQNVVDRELRKQGLSRWQLGREKFVQKVWEWREEYGNTILMQLRRLGCSYDWRYTRFTLDPEYVDAVLEVFVRWWQDGHLYIGERVINWCPGCRTAISDIEVEKEDEGEPGHLYHIRYPLADGSGCVVVATTRPETMLGDVAVAVNTNDERYQALIGKPLRLPLVDRIIPLIGDPYPDPEFGTGAVKVTPAHDPNDFEMGQRHNLPRPVIMNEDATINTASLQEELNAYDNTYLTAYHGKDRYEARKMVVTDLESGGFLEKVEDYRVSLGRCERCHSVIEPLLSEQWFVRMQQIAAPAIQVVKDEQIRFIPERYEEIYLNWMENIRDWCISRQLWWGHQIPAWYCVDCAPENFEDGIKKRQNPIVQKEPPTECPRCGSKNLVRDPDVLDTWFSSAIWPQTVLGWPRETNELKLFYPTSMLMTAQEILYLWVARMIMTGLYFVDEKPFDDVYIHATVLNKEGKRMSKSLGTGINPMGLMEQYGADALRWAVLQQAGLQQSLRFYEQRVESARNFANKIWNAARFVQMNLDQAFESRYKGELPREQEWHPLDRWILSRLHRTIETVNQAINEYRFDEGANALYEFTWSEFCDWYVEAIKTRLRDPETRYNAQTMLVYTLDQILRLLHPYMPYITEEIWQSLPHQGESLMIATYPQANANWLNEEAEAFIERMFETIRAIRNLRAEVKITPGTQVETIYLEPTCPENADQLRSHEALICDLAWFKTIRWSKPPAETKALSDALAWVEIALPVEGVIDTDKESERLRKEIGKIEQDLRRVHAKLRNPQFLEKANPEIVLRERELETELLARHQKLQERLKRITGEKGMAQPDT